MQAEAGESIPDLDRVEESVEGEGLKMAPSPWYLGTMTDKSQVAKEASGILPSCLGQRSLPACEDEVMCGGEGALRSVLENEAQVKSVAS